MSDFKLLHMKTLHRIIDATLYVLWFILFAYTAVTEENMLLKVVTSLCAFLVAAYIFMSILYGIVRFKPKMFMVIPYMILFLGMCYNIFEKGISIYNILFICISLLGTAECFINKKIEELKRLGK